MMETMGDLRRTHYVGGLREKDAGTEMTVAGSVARCRDKGGVVFVDLRDTTGILQLIFDDSTDKDVFEKASSLKSEYVIIARGTLREREAKTDKIPTGCLLYTSPSPSWRAACRRSRAGGSPRSFRGAGARIRTRSSRRARSGG